MTRFLKSSVWLCSLCHMLHTCSHIHALTCVPVMCALLQMGFSTIPRLFPNLVIFHVPVFLSPSLTFTKSDVVSTSWWFHSCWLLQHLSSFGARVHAVPTLCVDVLEKTKP